MKINSPLFFNNDHNGAGACLTADAQINVGTITPYVGGTAGSALSTGTGQQQTITAGAGGALSFVGSSAIGGIDNITLERYVHSETALSMSHGYEYDGAGNKTKITVTDSGGGAYSAMLSYSYDGLNRLTKEDRSGYSPYTLSYAFDAASTLAPSTRTAMTKVSGGMTKATAYEYNAGDQLTRMTKVGDGVRNDYYYDDAGCLTGVTKVSGGSSQPWTYQWDAAGRLTRAGANGVAATYSYDSDGNRVYRQASGLTKTWTYQGTNIASTADMTIYGTWSNQSYYSVAPGQVGNALERHTNSGGSTSSQFFLGHCPRLGWIAPLARKVEC